MAANTLFTLHNERHTEDVTADDIHVVTNGRPAEADHVTMEHELLEMTTHDNLELDNHPFFHTEDNTTESSIATQPSLLTTVPRELVDISKQSTTMKVLAGEPPSIDPNLLTGEIPANSCDTNICMNGGTCVMTAEGWQVSNQRITHFFHQFHVKKMLIFFLVPLFVEKRRPSLRNRQEIKSTTISWQFLPELCGSRSHASR